MRYYNTNIIYHKHLRELHIQLSFHTEFVRNLTLYTT